MAGAIGRSGGAGLREGSLAPSIGLAVKRLILLPFLFVIVACSEKATDPVGSDPAAGGAAEPAKVDPLDDSDCNLQTVLDPKKPGSPGNLIPSTRNPNGDSELAVLMRTFVDGLRDARVLVEAEQKLEPLFPVHRNMRCAWPTVASDRDEGYDARAQGYLASVRAFDTAPSKATYNAIVNNCVACHQVSCGGVIEFIQTLRWE